MSQPIDLSTQDPIFVAGHRGMVGQALVRQLRSQGYHNLICKTRAELDLLNQSAVAKFLAESKPSYIFIAAAKVGGIHANNTYRAQFLYENLAIAANLIQGAHQADVQRLCFLGSSCVYPKHAPQPIAETALLTSPLEPTNEPYAIAKIAGIKLCETYQQQYGRDYFSVMPCNLYGPGDNYDLQNSHVIPALLRKAHEAKQAHADTMTVWGSGTPRREFLFVDDLAQACIHLMQKNYSDGLINVGCGNDLTIRELAETVAEVVGFQGQLVWDTSKPDGTPRKLMDSQKIRAQGWQPSYHLRQGLTLAYQDFLQRHEKIAAA